MDQPPPGSGTVGAGSAPPRRVLFFHTAPGFDHGQHQWSELQTQTGIVPIGESENPCVEVRIGGGVPASFAVEALRMTLLHVEATLPPKQAGDALRGEGSPFFRKHVQALFAESPGPK